MIEFPNFDPVALSLGPLKVRWYGLMYLLGFVAAWWLARRRAARPDSTWTPLQVDDLIFYAAIGVILGGRVGWILFYGTEQVIANPLTIFRIWEGGMSFHGGFLGVLASMWITARKYRKSVGDVFDFMAPLAPLGLGFGRIGNFINGELWGKPTDLPWAVIVDGVPRHASQLYEGALEGFLLFAILWWFTTRPRPRLAPSAVFLIGYGTFRFLIEFVRVPDENRGYLAFDWLTMGQILSLPMIVAGLWMLAHAYRRNQPSGNHR